MRDKTYPTYKSRRATCAYQPNACDVCIDCQNDFVEYGKGEQDDVMRDLAEALRANWTCERWPATCVEAGESRRDDQACPPCAALARYDALSKETR